VNCIECGKPSGDRGRCPACLARGIQQYIEAQANRTPEQIREARAAARAAHGPGVKLVNVVTGEEFTT
jgi:hypothetical protein